MKPNYTIEETKRIHKGTIEKIQDLIAGLALLVEFLLAHEVDFRVYVHSLAFCVYAQDKKEFGRLARILVGRKGKLEKVYGEFACSITRQFSDMVSLQVIVNREQVCERIVTGTKIVPGIYYPEHEEEIVEWKCK